MMEDWWEFWCQNLAQGLELHKLRVLKTLGTSFESEGAQRLTLSIL